MSFTDSVDIAEVYSHLVQSQTVNILLIPDPDDETKSTTSKLPHELLKARCKWFETTLDNDEEAKHAGRSPISYLLESWLLFDYFDMPALQDMVMDRMCAIVAKKLNHVKLVDERDVLLARGSGQEQLMKFVEQALAMSLVTGDADWSEYPALVGDVEVLRAVFESLRVLLKVNDAAMRFLQACEAIEWLAGQKTGLSAQQ